MSPGLGLWLYGTHTADVAEPRSGKLTLSFTEAALERWGESSAILSASMPTSPSRYPNGKAAPWIEGLLPEGEARSVIERVVGVRRGDTFALLAAIGRESAGAASFLPAGVRPPPMSTGTPEAVDLDGELSRLHDHPLGIDGEVRVSLAGVQDKLLLVQRSDGRWAKPAADHPSTHILKPENGLFPGLAINEAVCLETAKQLGLTTVDVDVEVVRDRPVLIVSRYDRMATPDGAVHRIHQEDLCQALSITPEPPDQKYQATGGPSLRDAATLLDWWSLEGPEQVRELLRLAVFNVAIGNADAHGKNISMIHQADGRSIGLAPAYDLASTTDWLTVTTRAGTSPVSRTMAMSVNDQYSVDQVNLDDFHHEALTWSIRDGREVGAELLERYPAAVERAAHRFDAPAALVERLLGRGHALSSGRRAGDGDRLAPPPPA